MNKNRKIIIGVVALAAIVLGVYFAELLLRGPVKGFIYRTFLVPELIRRGDYVDLAYTDSPNEERERFFMAYKQKQGFYGLKFRRATIEGTPLRIYIFTDNGYVTEIIDYTRDRYGPRKYLIKHPKDVLLGFRDANGQFVEKTTEEHYRDLALMAVD
jgi:hypothetical protein